MMQITRIIDRGIYPRKALSEARHAYRDFFSLTISPIESNQDKVTITVKSEYEHQGKEVILEFLNYLLDRSAEINLEAQ